MTQQSSNTVRIMFSLDCVLACLFVTVMLPHLTGLPLHDWLSFVFIIPFVLHLLFHWSWVKSMFPRLLGVMRGEDRFNLIWDALLYMLMLFAIVSGVLASEVALKALGFDHEPDLFWTKSHHQLSNLLFPMVGIHLALHLRWIINVIRGRSETSA